MTWPEGTRFEGKWREDKKYRGTLYSPDNRTRFTGTWKDEQRHGVGMMQWADET